MSEMLFLHWFQFCFYSFYTFNHTWLCFFVL